MMADYKIANRNEVWNIATSTSGVDEGTVNTGRGYYIGTISTTLSTLAPGRTIPNSVNAPFQTVDGINVGGATGILSAGTFANQVAGVYSMKRVTTTHAGGIPNTFLRSGATYNSGRRSINKLEAVRTTQVASAIRSGNWNIFTGTFSSGPNDTEDARTPSLNNQFGAFDQQAGNGAISGVLDDAANPTPAIPGEFTLHHGSGQPVLFDYAAKTTWG